MTRTSSRSGRGELLDRVDRVGGAVAVELDPRGLEAVDAVERGDEHLVADLGRRDHASVLLPRIAGDDHEHPVEAELVAGRGRVHQVADVHRIEGAAEDPDAFSLGSDPLTGRVYEERCVNRVLRASAMRADSTP